MADVDLVRRREIRKRKLLEQSEARLIRIANIKKNQESETRFDTEKKIPNPSDTEESELENFQSINKNDLPFNSPENFLQAGFHRPVPNPLIQENICNFPSNGATQRSNTADNYIFPKKVSDTETRSFVRSRSDARRNSTCTQMMIETLQLSSFSLAIFRPWIAAILGVSVQMYFLFAGKIPIFQSLLLPYVLLEIGFLTWLQYESQVISRQASASFISGILLLYNISPHLISRFKSILYYLQSGVQDLSIYIFSFMFLHFVCESYM